jgi:hypothetical protein
MRSIDNYDKIAENQKKFSDPQQLVEKHNANCPFRSLVVSDQLIDINLIDEEKLLNDYLCFKDTYKDCLSVPCLTESIYEEIGNKGFDTTAKQRTISILSMCGWSYKKEKNIIQCLKCLRSVGLWLYKEDRQDEESSVVHHTERTSDESETNLHGRVGREEPTSANELIIFNTISKMINSIEIQSQQIADNLKGQNTNDDTTTLPNKVKRKRSNVNEQNADDYCKLKLLDPTREHFSWCPWLKEISFDEKNKYKIKKFSNSSAPTSTHQQHTPLSSSKNVCQLNFEIINQILSQSTAISNTDEKYGPKRDTNSHGDLLEQVKSAQLILMDCTSQFTLK